MTAQRDDLIVLVADKNMEATVAGLIVRRQSLQIRTVKADVYPHPECDPGCYLRAHEFLGIFAAQYEYALVLFDREGCGQSKKLREELEEEVQGRLNGKGWKDRSAVIVLDPELEAWVWSDSPEVDRALGWSDRQPDLRSWLEQKGYLRQGEHKPDRPKEAMEAAMRVVRKSRSSAIYRRLSERVSLARCTDSGFAKLKGTLQTWFAP